MNNCINQRILKMHRNDQHPTPVELGVKQVVLRLEDLKEVGEIF